MFVRQPITDLYFKIEDLIEDNEYEFRVLAENKVGRGPPSQPSDTIKAKDPWGKEPFNKFF